VSDWRFLTNHAHVLHAVAREPEIRLREIGERVGITERAVHGIVCDLEKAGYLTRHHVAGHNIYEIHVTDSLRERLEHQVRVGDIVDLLLKDTREPAGIAISVEG
jgi:DNA-binding MarR family transcriptional regulator